MESTKYAAGADLLLRGRGLPATDITSRSRKGSRSSRLCAIVIQSALTRMLPGSQVPASTSCMVEDVVQFGRLGLVAHRVGHVVGPGRAPAGPAR